MKNTVLTTLFAFIVSVAAAAQTGQAGSLRSLSELFPGLNENQKREIFSRDGIINSAEKNEAMIFIPAPGSGIDLISTVMRNNPSYLAESLLVIPHQSKVLSRLDAYNALSKVGDLKGRLYRSHTRNAEVPLFEDATRIESAQRDRPIPDPPLSTVLPQSETIYMRLRDVNFGNSFYKAEFSTGPYGLTYNLSNFRNLRYLVFTVMKEEKFSAILYMEPLAEGMMVYSVAGADASDFIASKIDIPSAISKRLSVFIAWISDNIKSL